MAKANKIVRYVKESPNLEPAQVRAQKTKPTGLYLLKLRSHIAKKQSPAVKRNLVIQIDLQNKKQGLSKANKIKPG